MLVYIFPFFYMYTCSQTYYILGNLQGKGANVEKPSYHVSIEKGLKASFLILRTNLEEFSRLCAAGAKGQESNQPSHPTLHCSHWQ